MRMTRSSRSIRINFFTNFVFLTVYRIGIRSILAEIMDIKTIEIVLFKDNFSNYFMRSFDLARESFSLYYSIMDYTVVESKEVKRIRYHPFLIAGTFKDLKSKLGRIRDRKLPIIKDETSTVTIRKIEDLDNLRHIVTDKNRSSLRIIFKAENAKLEWYSSSHTVNLYENRVNTNCFSIGDFAKNHAEVEDFIDFCTNFRLEDYD